MPIAELVKYINRLPVLVGLGMLLLCNFSALAAEPDFHVGEETDISRNTVHPSVFPVAKIGVDLKNDTQDPNDEVDVDAEFRMSVAHPKAFTLSAPNAFWGEKDSSTENPLRLSFGRRLIGWSSMDEMWGLGNIEPRDAWDQLRPGEQGLTGLFGYTETHYLNFHFFFSYLMLPELTPNVVIENNQFVPDHPQSISTAPQTFLLFNQSTPIGYQISLPPLANILFRPSVLFSVDTKKNVPIYAKFIYGNLPLNYFPIALQGKLFLPSDGVPVVLTPILLSHQIYNGEVAYFIDDRTSLGVNVLYDQPQSINLPTDVNTYTPLTNSVTWSPWLKYSWPRAHLLLSQLWSRGGLDSDVGPQANPSGSIVSSHILYRNASQVALQYLFWPESVRFATVQFKYLHEYSIEGNWFALDFNYHFQRNLSVLLGGDFLSAKLSASPDKGAEFLSDLRTLDRIRIGAQYGF